MPEKSKPSPGLTREDLIEVLQKATESQLRALRLLRKAQRAPASTPGARKSNMDIVKDILTAAPGPLHINQILEQAQRQYRRKISRESLVSALAKKVLDQNTFIRVGRNTFDLLERRPPT
jgi:hypothetical protein